MSFFNPWVRNLFTAFVLVFLLNVTSGTTVARNQPKCRILVNRLTIFQRKHVWVCECLTSEGNDDSIGRVEQKLEPFQVTAGHEQAVLRCQRHNQNRLLDACRKGSDQYQKVAAPIIRTCVANDLNEVENALTQPLTYKEDRCRANFFRFIRPQTGGVWVCQCLQEMEPGRSYFVTIGRADFLTNSSPIEPVEEVSILESCTREAIRRVTRVCRVTPGDFQLLALQVLQVCCKRARVRSDLKLQCSAAVPDDVSPLKDPFITR